MTSMIARADVRDIVPGDVVPGDVVPGTVVPGDIVPGTVLPIDRYLVAPQALWRLSHGGTLYLVAASYLVAVLEAPERARVRRGDRREDGWYAAANIVPVTALRGIELGELPRVLAPAEEAALRALFDDEGDAPVIAAPPAAARLVAQLEDLLAIWRTTRSAEVADVIDRATRLLPRFDLPLLVDARDEEAGHARWMETWRDERAEAMPQLVRNLSIRDDRLLPDRLAAIEASPADPRIARHLARRIDRITASTRQAWVRIIRDSRDAGAWQMLAPMLPELAARGDVRGLDRMLAFTVKAPPRTPLLDAQRARVQAIAATLVDDTTAASLEASLIDAIAEHPDEDEPYLIYSDWLLERGHPRGEYIALARQKQRGTLTPGLARRLAVLEGVPYLFGIVDELATQLHRPKPRGIDRELISYWSTTNAMWLEAARSPLVRALEAIALVGNEREDRITGLAALARAAPRLRRIEGFAERALARRFAKELGWRVTDDDAIART